MIKSYLKIAWRNLLKHKGFSLINILGLSIGISACLIIFLYVHNEMTFDQYNAKADRIVRVTSTMHAPESDVVLAPSPTPLAGALKRDFPEVEAVVRLEPAATIVKFKNEYVREGEFFKTDPNIFAVFRFDFLEGFPATALQNPGSIVITASIAKKYFGSESALGKTMICDGQHMLVTGIVKDRPANSDLPISALLSADYSKVTSWMDDFSLYSFVLFYKKPDLKNFERKLAVVGKKYIQPELHKMGADKYSVDFQLEPLSAVHFSTGKLGDTPKGNKQFSYIFSLLAIFILVIALLNYINLSTARSAERAKEVGIRKVSGAGRIQLMWQFLFESFLLIAIACAIAVGLMLLGLPFFNTLSETKLVVNWMDGILFIGAIFLITLLLAGLYPAFVLSAFKPVKVLKGNWRHSGAGVLLRKIVTVTQFAIAAALIMGTTIIYHQMKFIQGTDLGFSKDRVINIFPPRDSIYISAVHAFQQELRQRPEVQDLTVGNGMTDVGLSIGSTNIETDGKKREVMCLFYSIDPHFLPLFQIHLLEGRNMSDSFGTDKKEAFLVNEAFVKTMGWKSGLGKPIEGFDHKGKIVGVVKDFYFKSLHNLIEPLVMVYNTTPANTTTIKMNARDLPMVKELFKTNFPTIPIDYSFMDEQVDKQYVKDRITMTLFNDFTVLAIFVSCLGLYGLVALIAVQRTKEIGVRKVLGASLNQLLSLMAKDFVKLVFWALVISLPLAAMAMNKWLASYAYHIGLSWWMFLIPVIVLLFIALTVISREIIKAALANPVNSLRSE